MSEERRNRKHGHPASYADIHRNRCMVLGECSRFLSTWYEPWRLQLADALRVYEGKKREARVSPRRLVLYKDPSGVVLGLRYPTRVHGEATGEAE